MRKTFLTIAVPTAILLSLFALYSGFMGVFPIFVQRGVHLMLVMILVFLTFPFSNKKWAIWVDLFLVIFSAVVFGYVAINNDAISFREGLISPVAPFQMIFGIIAILLVLEGTRRTVGLPLALFAFSAIIYGLWGGGLPGILGHRGWSLMHIINTVYLSNQGIFGSALGVSATYAILFILFGSFLSATKISALFFDLASIVAGKTRGGPAKIAVISSGFFGMISGATVANIYSTGTISIPLMKKLNYKASFAGAVEAAASTGGQILPPVMGAVAFMMADITGIPYIVIVKSALFPALLYFAGILMMVDLEAVKHGLKGLPAEEIPKMKETLKKIYLILSPIVLVYLLLQGYSAFRAVTISIMFTVVISVLNRDTRLSVRGFFSALEDGAKNVLLLACACASAGIIMGVITLTGLALRFTGLVINQAGGSLLMPLLLTMFTCLILGMGLPTVPAYIVVCALAVPTLITLGLLPMQAHMFALYFAVLACVTPPVCMASFAAASIAGAPVNQTSFAAFKLALPGFIIPFSFALNPALLFVGEPLVVIWAIFSASVGIISLSSSLMGYLLGYLNVIQRIMLTIGGVFLIAKGIQSDIFGIAILSAMCLWQLIKKKKKIDVVA